MNGVAERVEDRGNIEIDAFVVAPDVGHRQRDVFGEGAGTVHANAQRVRAEMAASGQAIAASAADDVALPANDIAREEIVDVRANLYDAAGEFVAYGHRYGDGALRPIVPLVNVDVRPANARAEHLNQDVVNTNLGLGNVFEPKSWLALAFH